MEYTLNILLDSTIFFADEYQHDNMSLNRTEQVNISNIKVCIPKYWDMQIFCRLKLITFCPWVTVYCTLMLCLEGVTCDLVVLPVVATVL